MAVWEKLLGTAAALAVGGLAVAGMSYVLRKQQERIDADIAESEEDTLDRAAAELDAEELAAAGELDADAGAVAAAALESQTDDNASLFSEKPAPKAPSSVTPLAQPGVTPPVRSDAAKTAPEPLAGFTPRADNGPNPNPLFKGKETAPRRADGKLDPEKICSPDDFGNWEDLGCQG